VYGIIPRARGNGDGPKPKNEKPKVPADAREIGWWRLAPDAGLTFACLTGDFNPVHWVTPYAKASGFRSTILHGFATLARSIESMNRVLWAGDTRRLAMIDVRFTRPLRLPARVGCYVDGEDLYVGDGPGAPAYLTGSFKVNS
jgi:acyl dehydratase